MFGLTLLFLHHFDLFVNVFLIVDRESIETLPLVVTQFLKQIQRKKFRMNKKKKKTFSQNILTPFHFTRDDLAFGYGVGQTTWVRDLFLNQFFETEHTCKGLNQGRARNQEKATTLSTLSRRLS